jgi:hypothetical protein
MRSRLGIALATISVAGCALALSIVGSADATQHARAASVNLPQATRSHIETWAYDDGCNGGNASTALIRHWVTFAESNCGTNERKALSDCHSGGHVYCDVMQYLDTGWVFPGDTIRHGETTSSPENWWLHAPRSRSRIYSKTYGGGYLINQANPSVRSFFSSYVRRHANSADGLLMDWQVPSLQQELYYATCGCTTTSEIHSNGQLRTAHAKVSEAMRHRNGSHFLQFDNSLPPNPYVPQGFSQLNHARGVVGWTAEGLPIDGGVMDPFYSTLLDQIAYVDHHANEAITPMARADVGASYVLRSRRVQEGTMLLGYKRGHLVDWANLEQGSSHLAIWPEEGIVPTAPVESMGKPGGAGCLAGHGRLCSRGGHRSIEVAGGVYRREFSHCYKDGSDFGRCAAIVNTTGHAVTVSGRWLRLSYHHQITFRGGDVQSGGSVDLTGAGFSAGGTQVGPQDAILLSW